METFKEQLKKFKEDTSYKDKYKDVEIKGTQYLIEIFRYIDNEFFKIYDFNAQVGDSISYPGLFQDSSCDTIKYFITKKGILYY